MKHHYTDILSRIAEPPTWFDENGTPRYGAFHPSALPDIYAREACLLLIRCQNCGTEFQVGMSWSQSDAVLRKQPSLRSLIESGEIHYGDPPNMHCCPSGPTMNSVPVRVLEFWESDCRADNWWLRVKGSPLECEIKCDWDGNDLDEGP